LAKGIDISHYQNDRGNIDFGKVKSDGYSFTIIKATEGSESGSAYVDPYLATNVNEAHKSQLAVHTYHFFRAVSEQDSRAEAQWLIKNISGLNVDYVFCDVEYAKLTSNKNKLTSYVNAFFDELSKAGYNHLGIYTGYSFMNSRLIESNLRGDLYKWIARYNDTLGRSADCWQYQSDGKVNGIIGNVDINIDYSGKLSDSSVSNPKPQTINKPENNSKSHTANSKPSKVLKNGDKGSAVLAMQKKLASVYYYPDKDASDHGCDSIFGKKTEDALRRFQSTHGCKVDGVYGSETAKALDKAIGEAKKKPSKPKSRPYYIVVSGDSLWEIATKNHMSVSKLKSINHLKSDTIYPGNKLYLK
jgi:lysozyme